MTLDVLRCLNLTYKHAYEKFQLKYLKFALENLLPSQNMIVKLVKIEKNIYNFKD